MDEALKVVLCGDSTGIEQLIQFVPANQVAGVMGAIIRPQYLYQLADISRGLGKPLIIQPRATSGEYTDFLINLHNLEADLLWINSYSMVIRPDALAEFRLGGVNIHMAPLPRFRGCSPIQWAIIQDEREMGVTLHEVSHDLDAGPIIDQRRLPLLFEDSWESARTRLNEATDELIAANVESILSGDWLAREQDHQLATYGPRRHPADGRVNWQEPLIDIYNKIRALLPPLPPAFVESNSGSRREFTSILSPMELLEEKFLGGGLQHMSSERIRLRPLRNEDCELLYEWISDGDLVLPNSPVKAFSENQCLDWMPPDMKERNDVICFVIENLESSTEVGICQLETIDWVHRNAELRILIGNPDYRGRGLGSEAIRLLCEFGFNDLNLHRIHLQVFAKDTGAIVAHEELGFKEDGKHTTAANIDEGFVEAVSMTLRKFE